MQKWTVKRSGPLWLVLHNGEAVERFHTEESAWTSAWRRASTSAQKRGVTPARIGDEITVAGDNRLTSAEKQVSRAARLKAAAIKAGCQTIDELARRINDEEVTRIDFVRREAEKQN